MNRLPSFVPYTSGTSKAGTSSSLVNVFPPLLIHGDFPCGSAGKETACTAGDLGSIPGLGRPPGEGKVCPLQYSGLENSMDCIVHGVTKSWTRLSKFHFHWSMNAITMSVDQCLLFKWWGVGILELPGGLGFWSQPELFFSNQQLLNFHLVFSISTASCLASLASILIYHLGKYLFGLWQRFGCWLLQGQHSLCKYQPGDFPLLPESQV